MISYLRGTIRSVLEDRMVLDVGGVGYELWAPAGVTQYAAEHLGEEAEYHVYTYVQGANVGAGRIVLVGFQDYPSKQLFEKLIQVSGVGPKAALRALVLPPRDLADAIEQGNMPLLRKLPGFGARTAEKVVAQLKGKLYDVLLARESSAPKALEPEKEFVADTRAVLLQLGYSASDATAMIDAVLEDNPKIDSFQDLIREIYRRQAAAQAAEK